MNEGLISGGTAGWERAEVGGGGGGGGASVAVPSTVIILLISILRFLHAIDGSSSLKKNRWRLFETSSESMPWRKMRRHSQKSNSINNTWRLGCGQWVLCKFSRCRCIYRDLSRLEVWRNVHTLSHHNRNNINHIELLSPASTCVSLDRRGCLSHPVPFARSQGSKYIHTMTLKLKVASGINIVTNQ